MNVTMKAQIIQCCEPSMLHLKLESDLFSLKELLAGRLQLAIVVAENPTGTVSDSIPGVVAGRPGECPSERIEQIVKSPAHEHIVVGGEHKRNDNCGHTNTCRVTRRGRRERVRPDSGDIIPPVGMRLDTFLLILDLESVLQSIFCKQRAIIWVCV